MISSEDWHCLAGDSAGVEDLGCIGRDRVATSLVCRILSNTVRVGSWRTYTYLELTLASTYSRSEWSLFRQRSRRQTERAGKTTWRRVGDLGTQRQVHAASNGVFIGPVVLLWQGTRDSWVRSCLDEV